MGRPGKAKSPLRQKEGALALDGNEKENMLLAPTEKITVPGQALAMTESQPLPGCEDTGITTFWLAKPLTYLLQEYFIESRMEGGHDCSPRQLLEFGLLGTSPCRVLPPSPASPHHPPPPTRRCSEPLSFCFSRCQLNHSAVTISILELQDIK